MKGVSPVIESVLLAAAIIIFMLGVVGAFNNFLNKISEQKIKNTLKIDGEKIGYAILTAKKIGENANGSVKIYVSLSDLPEVIEVKEGGVYVKSGKIKVVVPLYGAESYVNKSFSKVTNTYGYEVYVLYSNGDIKLGVE